MRFLAILVAICSSLAVASQPNFLLVMVDDMGFSDLGCYGSEIPTPNIDAIAAEGLRYTDYHSAPMCSPTRASLLTGKIPSQHGVHDWLAAGNTTA